MKLAKKLLVSNSLALVVLLMIVVNSLLSSSFLKAFTFGNVLTEVAYMGMLAMGMTFVILTGGIDLSVGALAGLTTVVVALITDAMGPSGWWVALLAGVAVSAVLGLFNGLCVAKLQLPALIVTLGMTWVANGIGNTLLKGTPLGIGSSPLKEVLRYKVGSWVPVSFLITVVVLIILSYILKNLHWGREFYSVGSNQYAAHISGTKTSRVLVRAYFVSGLFAGLAGIFIAMYGGSGYASAATDYETYSIAAVVMAGVSMSGGEGKIHQTLWGVCILRLLNKLVTFSGLSSISGFIEGIVVGSLLIVVLLLNNSKVRKEV